VASIRMLKQAGGRRTAVDSLARRRLVRQLVSTPAPPAVIIVRAVMGMVRRPPRGPSKTRPVPRCTGLPLRAPSVPIWLDPYRAGAAGGRVARSRHAAHRWPARVLAALLLRARGGCMRSANGHANGRSGRDAVPFASAVLG